MEDCNHGGVEVWWAQPGSCFKFLDINFGGLSLVAVSKVWRSILVGSAW